MNNIKLARSILETSNSACDCTNDDYTFTELKELVQEILDVIESGTDESTDFTIDTLACGEVRVIHESVINELWSEGIEESIKDCYDLTNITDLPFFIVIDIDWEATVDNCKRDGMGHHFSGYDGEEHDTDGYHIFRTN